MKRQKYLFDAPKTEAMTLYNRSCETMEEIADGSVDLVVTSPPYWVAPDDPLLQSALLQGADGLPETYEELLTLLSRCFRECFRVLKPGGICAINVASTRVKGRLYPLPFDLAVRLLASGWELKEDIIWRRWRGWDKRGGVFIQNPYPGYYFPNRIFEYVLVCRKPGPPIYRDRTAAQKERSRIPIDDFVFHELNNNIWNILPVQPLARAKAGREGVSHPCPYPDELAFRLISLYSYAGDTVLDPFTGSGTTAKVAHLLARKFIGYEINPDFIPVIRQRIREPRIGREQRVARFEELNHADSGIQPIPNAFQE